MNRLVVLCFMVLPMSVFAQEAAEKPGLVDKYFMGIGLVIFLALFGVYAIFEKIRDRNEDKVERLEEEARQLRIKNSESESI